MAAGVCNNIGLLLQKRAVKRLEAQGWGLGRSQPLGRTETRGHTQAPEHTQPLGPLRGRDAGFFSRLVRQPLWLLGLAAHFGLGTVVFLLAQVHIGPALIPGLMAAGLIVLVLGSLPISGDPLERREIAGVLLMAAGISLLGLSRLSIDLRRYDVLSPGFLRRAALFSAAVSLLVAAAVAAQRRGRGRDGLPWRDQAPGGIILALLSGFLYVLSNFWVGPFIGVTLRILGRNAALPHYLLFAFGSAVLVLTNFFAIGAMQGAFRRCKAAQAIPIQNTPVQLAPAFVYLAVFRLSPPARYSVGFLGLGTALVLSGSFLLAGRRARLAAASPRPS